MKIYLAHNLAARDWLQQVIPVFEAKGHIITSRWITDDSHLLHSHALDSAIHDLEDITKADWLILFTDQYKSMMCTHAGVVSQAECPYCKGRPGKGKFIELGFALRAGKKCILVGEDQDSSVFYLLPNIGHAKTIEEALVLLS